MAKKASPAEVLELNRRRALGLAATAGSEHLRKVLARAQADLNKRLEQAEGLRGKGDEPFSAVQMRVTLAQVQHVLGQVQGGLRDVVTTQGQAAAVAAAGGTLDYLQQAERRFRGVNQALPLREASMLDHAVQGSNASVLRRLMGDPEHRARPGILRRYGENVVGKFEEQLQLGMLARRSWADTRRALVDQSTFLQGAPAHWAERIVRTETMHAYNRAGFEAVRHADEVLGDMVKILSATFDARTGADSYAVHGQIRRPAEAFQSWFGAYQHPPNRPNDREIVVPHRLSWPIPDSLAWRDDGEVAEAWARHGNKGSPPGRPLMTTVPLDQFGKVQPPPPEPEAPAPEPAEVEHPPEPKTQPFASPEEVAAQVSEQELPEAPEIAPRGFSDDARGRAARLKFALNNLDELPASYGDPEHVVHGLEVSRRPDGSFGSPFTDEEQRTIDRALDEITKAAKEGHGPRPRRVSIGELSVSSPDAYRVHLLEELHEPRAEPVVVVRKGGKLHVNDGLESVAARRLEGRRSVQAHVIDLDAKQPVKIPPKPKPKEEPKPKRIPLRYVPKDERYSEHILEKLGKGAFGWNASNREELDLAAKKVFKGKAPAFDSLEQVWGRAESGHRIKLRRVEGEASLSGRSGVKYEGDIMRNDQLIGSITRTFIRHPNDQLEVHHDYFKINSNEQQGGGMGEAMLRQSIHAYDELGVDYVTVGTAWVGKYTWASFGYNWDEQTAERMGKKLTDFLVERNIPETRARDIADRVKRRAWDVALLDVDGIMEVPNEPEALKVPERLGKVFLLNGGGWSGKIDMRKRDTPQWERMKVKLKL